MNDPNASNDTLSDEELASVLAIHQRATSIIEGMTLRTAGEVIGMNSETLRRYLAGKGPSRPFLFLAQVCRCWDINANWLLLGKGPSHLQAMCDVVSETLMYPAVHRDISSTIADWISASLVHQDEDKYESSDLS